VAAVPGLLRPTLADSEPLRARRRDAEGRAQFDAGEELRVQGDRPVTGDDTGGALGGVAGGITDDVTRDSVPLGYSMPD
jgi:hypothetical protein